MTLRLRLMVIIGLSFSILWGATSIWMFFDVRTKFRDALDERLAASARMVAGLVTQLPSTPGTRASAPGNMLDVVAKDGVACEIRLLNGGLIARTHNSPEALGLIKSGYSTRTIHGEEWRSYTLEQGHTRVTTADRADKRLALLHNVVLATVVPFVVAMFGGLIVLWLGIRQGLKPLETIRQALEDRKPDAAEPLPEKQLPAEIAPLVHTINLLLNRTQHAIDRERRFTGDAAHELRTPLTAIKTHIQVARLATGEETARSLEHAEEGARRLQRTLEQLLMLARVEGPFSFEAEDKLSASEIAALAISDIPLASGRRIVVEEDNGRDGIAVPPVLAITALRNLLDNALQYSAADTQVVLRLARCNKAFRFTVLDQGYGMSEAERARSVQRFWRKGTGHGSGLGLSIVEAIVKRFGGSFHMSARPDGGLAVQVEFPCLAHAGHSVHVEKLR